MKKKTASEETKAKTASAYVLPFSSKGKPCDKPQRPNVTSIFRIDITGNVTAQVIGQFGGKPGKLLSAHQYAYLPAKTLPRKLKHSALKCSAKEWKTLIEQTHDRATEWLAKFRGVASKYLENYWAWFSLIRQIETRSNNDTEYMYQCF